MFIWPPYVAHSLSESLGTGEMVGVGISGVFGADLGEYVIATSDSGHTTIATVSVDTLEVVDTIRYFDVLVPYPVPDTASFEVSIDPVYLSTSNFCVYKFTDFSSPIDVMAFSARTTPTSTTTTALSFSDPTVLAPHEFTVHPTLPLQAHYNIPYAGTRSLAGVVRSSATEYWFIYKEYYNPDATHTSFVAVRRVLGYGGYWDTPVILKTNEIIPYSGYATSAIIVSCVYAGEGWAYLLYTLGEEEASPVEYRVMAVDFTASTPVQYDVAIPYCDSTRYVASICWSLEKSYVTVGSYRVIALVLHTSGPDIYSDRTSGSAVLVLRYTESTKATPLVDFQFHYKPNYGEPGEGIWRPSACYIETEPATDEAYLITYDAWTAGYSVPYTVSVLAEAHNLGLDGSTPYPLSYGDGKYIYSNEGNTYTSSAQSTLIVSAHNGEATLSMLVLPTYSGGWWLTKLALRFWHTPTNYDRSLDCSDSYAASSFGVVRIRSRSLDIVDTHSGAYFKVEMPLDYSGTYLWEMNASAGSEYLVGVDLHDTYAHTEFGVVKLTIITAELDQYYPIIGTAWMSEFMVYINQDRAVLGLPPYKTFGEDGLFLRRRDIANLHANNMTYTKIYAHEDPGFPSGQQTITERLGLMNVEYGSENLQIASTFYLPTNYSWGIPTPYDAYLAWHDSPVHYANITNDFGVDNNEKVYSLLGYQEARNPASYPDYEDILFAYLCNNFVVLEDYVVEATLEQYWDNAGAIISHLLQEWSLSAYTKVKVEHSSVYALCVSAQVDMDWGCRAAASLIAPITYSVQVGHIAYYTSTELVLRVQHDATYGINENELVVAEHSTIWGLSVGAENIAEFSYLGAVAAEHESIYGLIEHDPVAAEHSSTWGISVSAENEVNFNYQEPVAAWCDSLYDIRQYEPAIAEHTAPWGVLVSAENETVFSYQEAATAEHVALFDMEEFQPVSAEHGLSYGLVVSLQHSSGWSITLPVAKEHTAPYSELVKVAAEMECRYGVLTYNPVRKSMIHYYRLQANV